MGDYWVSLSHYEQAQAEYEKAIASYRLSLDRNPDDVEAHNSQGIVCLRLGELYTDTSELQQARANYQQALRTCQEVLKIAPDFIEAYDTQGMAWQGLGDLHRQIAPSHSRFWQKAQKSYQKAIQAYDFALDRAPSSVSVHHHTLPCKS